MSWRKAPLYVRSHDLARWILERTRGWSPNDVELLGTRLAGTAQESLVAISLALTFPDERVGQLAVADRALVRLRVTLQLAQDLGLLSAGGTRYAMGELLVLGRMLGGWRKQVGGGHAQVTAEREEDLDQGMDRARCGSRRPWRELEQLGAERALGVPEQERSEEPVAESGLPGAAPSLSTRGHARCRRNKDRGSA